MKDFLDLMEEGEKLDAGVSQRAKEITNFEEKLVKFIELVANKPGYGVNKRKYLMKEAETTADFPILFGTILERTLLQKYKVAQPDWRNYVKVGTQNDFRKAQLVGLFGLQSSLSAVKERGEYTGDKLKDGKVDNVLLKYGRQFPLSWEALINDDLGAFSDIAERLANAALRTEWNLATQLIAQSSGPNTALFGTALTHPLDGATINNKGTDSFSADNLAKAVAIMRRLVDIDGEPIFFDGFELIYAPSLEIRVLQALNPASLIATGVTSSSKTQTSANVAAMLNIKPHLNPYLPIVDTSGNNNFTWYLIATLSNGAAVQMNFLRGHESPEIVQKVSDKVSLGGGLVSPMEGDFDTDTMRWRIRHIMGGTQIDPRLAYANVASS